jgi:hypothetical protein
MNTFFCDEVILHTVQNEDKTKGKFMIKVMGIKKMPSNKKNKKSNDKNDTYLQIDDFEIFLQSMADKDHPFIHQHSQFLVCRFQCC